VLCFDTSLASHEDRTRCGSLVIDYLGHAPAFRSSKETILRSSRPRGRVGRLSANVPRAAVGVLQYCSEGRASVTAVWMERKRNVPLRDPELQGG
jgi:hypothetical protein